MNGRLYGVLCQPVYDCLLQGGGSFDVGHVAHFLQDDQVGAGQVIRQPAALLGRNQGVMVAGDGRTGMGSAAARGRMSHTARKRSMTARLERDMWRYQGQFRRQPSQATGLRQ